MIKQSVSVSTLVPCASERAWKLYTTPSDVTQWNFANDEWHCPLAEIDLTIGGEHRARMEAKDGSFGFDFEGTYSEIDTPRALTLVLSDGRKSRTTFTPSADGTLVETTFDVESENCVEMQRAGWQAILNNYRRYAERDPSIEA